MVLVNEENGSDDRLSDRDGKYKKRKNKSRRGRGKKGKEVVRMKEEIKDDEAEVKWGKVKQEGPHVIPSESSSPHFTPLDGSWSHYLPCTNEN